MHIRVNDVHPGVAGTPDAGTKLLELIAPAIANGEVVELDFDGVRYFSPLFFYCSVGKLIEADRTERVPPLIRYTNLSERGKLALDSGVEFAIHRREDPIWAKAMGIAAEKMAERD